MPGYGYDFYDMETTGMEVLQDGAKVEIHVRDQENLESKAVRAIVSRSSKKLKGAERLYIYGRLGAPISDEEWYIQIIEELGDEALGPAAGVAMKPSEKVKKGRQGSS